MTKKLEKNNSLKQVSKAKADPIRRIQKIFENNIFLHEVSIKEIGKHAKEYDEDSLKDVEKILREKITKGKKKVTLSEDDLKTIVKSLKKHPVQSILFSKNTLVSMVSTLDVLFSKLFELYYKKFPEKLSLENQSIRFSDLKKITNIEEAQNFLISREIESLLFKKGISDRLNILKNEIGIDIKPIEDNIRSIKKIIDIRNLIVHNAGLADDDYTNKYNTKDRKLKVGDEIDISYEYLIESLYLMYFFGTYILQEVQLSFSEKIQPEDFLLNNLLHTLIKNSQFSYIKPIYNFSQNHKIDEMNKKLMVLNFCIGLKKQGKDSDHIKKVLDLEDWTIEKSEFIMCKSALLDNHKNFYNELEKLISNKEIGKQEVEEWVVFDFYRKDLRFKKIVKKCQKQ